LAGCRPADEKPNAPEAYPLHNGVIKVSQRVVPEVSEVVAKIKQVHGR
jgi:hypothetical protein